MAGVPGSSLQKGNPGRPIFLKKHLNQDVLIQQMQEQPVYTLHQSKPRTIIPKIITLLVLSFIFYLGVLLNISLLELRGNQETLLKTGTLIILIIIIIVGIFLSVRTAKRPYFFYKDRISFEKKQISYTDISNTSPHLDPIDKIFKTYSVNLGSKFFLRNIPQEIHLENYLQQLIQYAKRN